MAPSRRRLRVPEIYKPTRPPNIPSAEGREDYSDRLLGARFRPEALSNYSPHCNAQMIDVIAFDADDTLWHNERLFRATEREFRTLLARYHDEEWIEKRLYETEVRNLEHYG